MMFKCSVLKIAQDFHESSCEAVWLIKVKGVLWSRDIKAFLMHGDTVRVEIVQ